MVSIIIIFYRTKKIPIMEFLLQLIAELFAGSEELEQAPVMEVVEQEEVVADAKEEVQEVFGEPAVETANIFNVIQFH
jgi:hypothetical protein